MEILHPILGKKNHFDQLHKTFLTIYLKIMSTAKKLYGFEPDCAIPPGETLKEIMKSLNMSQKELAFRTGLTVQSLNRIFKGDKPISCEAANKLELATGVPACMWNNLEAQYREQLAKNKNQGKCNSSGK